MPQLPRYERVVTEPKSPQTPLRPLDTGEGKGEQALGQTLVGIGSRATQLAYVFDARERQARLEQTVSGIVLEADGQYRQGLESLHQRIETEGDTFNWQEARAESFKKTRDNATKAINSIDDADDIAKSALAKKLDEYEKHYGQTSDTDFRKRHTEIGQSRLLRNVDLWGTKAADADLKGDQLGYDHALAERDAAISRGVGSYLTAEQAHKLAHDSNLTINKRRAAHYIVKDPQGFLDAVHEGKFNDVPAEELEKLQAQADAAIARKVNSKAQADAADAKHWNQVADDLELQLTERAMFAPEGERDISLDIEMKSRLLGRERVARLVELNRVANNADPKDDDNKTLTDWTIKIEADPSKVSDSELAKLKGKLKGETIKGMIQHRHELLRTFDARAHSWASSAMSAATKNLTHTGPNDLVSEDENHTKSEFEAAFWRDYWESADIRKDPQKYIDTVLPAYERLLEKRVNARALQLLKSHPDLDTEEEVLFQLEKRYIDRPTANAALHMIREGGVSKATPKPSPTPTAAPSTHKRAK